MIKHHIEIEPDLFLSELIDDVDQLLLKHVHLDCLDVLDELLRVEYPFVGYFVLLL